MTSRQSRKVQSAELDPNEWCFVSVLKPEVQACFNYEYAREFAKQSASSSRPFSALYDWFPDKSWQALDAEIKSILMTLNYYSFPGYSNSFKIQSLQQLKENRVGIKELLRLVRAGANSDSEYGFFEIDWDHPDADIKRAFVEWLSGERDKRKKRGLTKIKYKLKGRGGFRDRLNWLGALRVVQHYRKSQLVDYADTNLKVDAPYCHLPDLYEGAKKAKTQLETLAKLYGRS